MFKFRLIGFILLMALLGGIFFWDAGGVWLFLAAAPALVGAAVGECCAMMDRAGRPTMPMPAAVAIWLIALGCSCGMIRHEALWATAMLTALLLICGGATLLRMDADRFTGIVNSLGVSFLFTPPLIALLLTYFLPERGSWLLYLCLVTKATDTGGYIVGTLTAKLPGGNHKIAPTVSPKKSYEGLIGGVILSTAVSWTFFRLAPAASPAWYLLAGLVLSFGSFFGDLTESAVKRFCGTKDSGSFVPGMGGAFDVLDSFLYNGLIFWPLYLIKDIL